MVEMQEVCPMAGNGAADCATAATKVCQAKGFKNGQPLDIRTAEKCNASLWVSGQTPATADCPVETISFAPPASETASPAGAFRPAQIC